MSEPAPSSDAPQESPDAAEATDVSVAARLGWHAVAICRCLDHGLDQLQTALTEVVAHTEAILDLALDAAADRASTGPADTQPASSPPVDRASSRPDPARPPAHETPTAADPSGGPA